MYKAFEELFYVCEVRLVELQLTCWLTLVSGPLSAPFSSTSTSNSPATCITNAKHVSTLAKFPFDSYGPIVDMSRDSWGNR